MKQPELMSFMEWRERNPVKKKEKKDESRSVTTNGEIGAAHDEGQAVRANTQIPIQDVHVFPCAEL